MNSNKLSALQLARTCGDSKADAVKSSERRRLAGPFTEALRDETVDDPSCREAAPSLKLRSLERRLDAPVVAPADVDAPTTTAAVARSERGILDGATGVRSWAAAARKENMRFHVIPSRLILCLRPTVRVRLPSEGLRSVTGELGSEGEQSLFMRAVDVVLATARSPGKFVDFTDGGEKGSIRDRERSCVYRGDAKLTCRPASAYSTNLQWK